MNFLDPRLWLDVLQCVAVAVLWLRKPGQDAVNELAKIKGRMDVLEERSKHMPSRQELAELEGTVKASQATLEAVRGQIEALQSSIDRIQNWLMKNQ